MRVPYLEVWQIDDIFQVLQSATVIQFVKHMDLQQT